MPGGQYNSSKTRVAPVFNALALRQDLWVRDLLGLFEGTDAGSRIPQDLDLTFLAGHWGDKELGLLPPISLLSWLLRNPMQPRRQTSEIADRAAVLQGNAEALARSLALLNDAPVARAWYVLEGRTFPDVVIETPDAIVVVEGKRTELGPTTSTEWLAGRHQIWRHIDAAWEGRGAKRVFGFFAVEGSAQDGVVPEVWREAARECLSPEVLATSFPHRSNRERAALATSFLGATTWQAIVRRFDLPESVLPSQV